jgi:hypothetical protein
MRGMRREIERNNVILFGVRLELGREVALIVTFHEGSATHGRYPDAACG